MISLICTLLIALYISTKSSRIFFAFVLLFLVAGSAVYEIRDLYFYNLPGSKGAYNQELLVVSLFLFPMAFIGWKPVMVRRFLRIEIWVLYFLEYTGMLVMTRFLSVVPLFQSDIDSGRAAVQAASGVGIGWFLLVFPGTLLFVSLFNRKSSRILKGTHLILAYIPFILYGGRSLMIFPLVVILFDSLLNRDKRLTFLQITSLGLVALALVLSFGVWRQFGELNLNSEAIAWLAADAATEYRSGVNVLHNLHSHRVSGFWQNLPAGLLPGFAWDLFGENKSEYYHQIGTIVTANSHYYKEFDGGMRLGLLGELAISNVTTRFIVLFTLLGMLYLTRYLRGYTAIIVYTCIIFSIPYGINFLMNGLQILVYSYCLFALLDVFRSNKNSGYL